jgi:hypothetical protein
MVRLYDADGVSTAASLEALASAYLRREWRRPETA